MNSAGVSRAVLVQHLGEFDNSYLQQVARDDPERLAAVCLVDHRSPSAASDNSRWAKTRTFRGVRFPMEVCAVAPELFATAVELELIAVLFLPDGLSDERTVDALDRLLENHRGARGVITHLGNPSVADGPEFTRHVAALAQLARHPGAFLQLSGMKMFCPYPHMELQPVVSAGYDAFGPARILWGSNYPVVGDASAYRDDLALLTGGKLPLPAEAIPAIAGENALRLWFSP
jgi:L-fuconolactonase